MTNSVQSLERAFCLLELLGEADHAVAISELARMSGLPLGTTHRLLDTLARLQYVEHDPVSHRYALGPRILHLRPPTLDKHNLGMQAMPVMKALMQRVNETVHLAVLDGGEIVYIDRIEGLQTQGMYTRIGKHNAVHCTALGKAMMAFQPAETVEQVIRERGLPPFTPNTLTTPEAFAAELEKVRAQGFAVDNQEGETGVRCVAAPLRDYSGAVVAALSISGPTARIRPSRDAELSEAACWASQLISTKLGYLESE
jgi:DNA-binding IclR family transcriptional regulator